MEKEMRCLISLYNGEEKVKSIYITDPKTSLPSVVEKIEFIDNDHLIVDIDQKNVKRYKIRGPLNETIVKKNYDQRSVFMLDKKQCKLIITLKNQKVYHEKEIVDCDTILIWYTEVVIIETMKKYCL